MFNKVLIITYYWPPSGGAGVQRWLKFAKYLPDYGWDPVVLTVDQTLAAYPVLDPSLEAEASGITAIRTAATNYFSLYRRDRSKIPTAGFAGNTDNTFRGKLSRFVRGNFFIPDPRRGWNRYAFREACNLIGEYGIERVITTSPPHSSQLIGLKLKKKYPHIRWIADLRDPWTDIYYYKQFYPSLPARLIDSTYEKRVLENADLVITVGENLRELLSSKIKDRRTKVHVITNGYDEEDFREATVTSPSTFRITYVGTLSDIYPVEGLAAALGMLKNEGVKFHIRFIGTVSEKQRNLIINQTGDSHTEFLPYAEHTEAIRQMQQSSLLLLVIPGYEGSRNILTGKLFEYLAAGRPVLCLGPEDGDAAKLLSSTGRGVTIAPSDQDGIKRFLSGMITGENLDMGDISAYSRKNLTARLADLLKG